MAKTVKVDIDMDAPKAEQDAAMEAGVKGLLEERLTDAITVNEIVEYLFVPLTDEEFAENAKKQARCQQDRIALERRKKSINDDLKAQDAKIEADLNETSRLITNGGENRPVRCEERLDYLAGNVTITRLDTGEIVKTRPLSVRECQTEIKA